LTFQHKPVDSSILVENDYQLRYERYSMKHLFTLTALFALVAASSLAADLEYKLVLKDHAFTPDTVEIPADTQVKLIVDNQDATAEEFESKDMKREKVIAGKSKATIMIGPLKPGEYTFFGEYNEATAKGKIVVK
jgi:plastocyanin